MDLNFLWWFMLGWGLFELGFNVLVLEILFLFVVFIEDNFFFWVFFVKNDNNDCCDILFFIFLNL